MHADSRDSIDDIVAGTEILVKEESGRGQKRLTNGPQEPTEPPPARCKSTSSGSRHDKMVVMQPAAKVVKLDEDSLVVSRTWLKGVLDCVDRAEVCLSEKLWSCPFKSAPRLRN